MFFCILVYANTLGNGLFFDDEHFIYKNPNVIDFSIGNFFTQSLTPQTGQPSNYYRPILFLTFGVEYAIFGDAAFIYHFDNMILHGICSILIYLLIFKIFKNKTLGFLTALIFVIHPIQTEAVSYANSRGDSLALFFILLSLYFVFSEKAKYYFFSLFSFILALLSKETAIITPFLIILVLTFNNKTISFSGFIHALKRAIPFFLTLFAYIFLRLTTLNFNNTLNFWGYENEYTKNIFVRLTTFLSLIPLYASLLVAPIILFMERDATIDIQYSITLTTIVVITIFISITIVAWKLKNKHPVLLFSLLWFVVSFGPTSGIIPINGLFYEHFLYIPSIGFFLFCSYVLILLLQRAKKIISSLVLLLFIIYLLFLSIRTIIRNNDWQNPILFYTQTLRHSKTARIYNNLAMNYADSNNYEKSITYYKKAIQLSDTYTETHYNLANAYVAIKKNNEAIKEYKKAILLNKWFIYPYAKLYELYAITNNKKGLQEITVKLQTLGKTNKNYLLLLQQLQDQNN